MKPFKTNGQGRPSRILFLFLSIFPSIILGVFLGPILGFEQAFADTYYRVELRAENKEQRSRIANVIHPDYLTATTVQSMVSEHDYLQLQNEVPELILRSEIDVDSILQPFAMDGDLDFFYPSGYEDYHTYQEFKDEIDRLVTTYPQYLSKESMGQTLEGNEIVGVRLSLSNRTQQQAGNLAEVLVIGTHHAREHLSTEVPLRNIEKIIEFARNNPNFEQVLRERVVYIFPMLNVDGVLWDIKGGRFKYWRKNRNPNHGRRVGVDLNRNYSFGWGTGGSSNSPGSDVYMGPAPFSEPETQAVKKFVEARPNISVLLSFHSFSELILYPWGGKSSGIGGEDQQVFEILADKMATWNNYKPMQASDLYVASGDTCDWAYGEHQIWCFTFELSPAGGLFGGRRGFYPYDSKIDEAVQANLKPLLYLIEIAANPRGVLPPPANPEPAS